MAADALITELRHHSEQLGLNPQRVAEHDADVAAYEAALIAWAEAGSDTEKEPKAPRPLVLYSTPPQFLDKVLKFLAQNGINAPASAPKVDALARRLADLDLEDEARPTH
jgi:hypothetical protein